jgi:Ca2+-transporting ATPase
VSKALLLPVLPTQLLWINLVAAVALALPLAFEAKEVNVMSRPPRSPKEPIMGKLVVRRTVLASVLMTIGAVGLFQLVYGGGLGTGAGNHTLAEAQTMAVTTVIFFQVFYLMNCRSLRDSVFKIGFFSNPTIFLGIGITLTLQAAFIYAPPLQAVFGTTALDAKELGLSFLAGVVTLPIITLEKWISAKSH